MQEVFSGRIRDVSSEGHGVVDHPDGRVFFVPGTWPGDEGDFSVVSIDKKYGSARLVTLRVASSHRRESPCRHFGLEPGMCGGCPWIFVDYEQQLLQKQKRVEFLIARNHLASQDFVVEKIKKSLKQFGYRNRAQFKTDGKVIGYVSPASKKIAAIEDCLILSDKNRETLQKIKKQLPLSEWQPEPPYLWNFLDINENVDVENLVLNRRQPFQQGNTEQNEFMKSWVREQVQSDAKTAPVVELFAGSGNFTRVLREAGFAQVFTAEVDKKAVHDGFTIDLYKPAEWKKIPKPAQQAELLFLDPPREGFSLLEKFVERFPKLKKIIYISCEPYTWAGNIKGLVDKNWQLRCVQPLDQFPHTPHIEVLSVLEKA
ncbi:class I SAM-dependent RNA methyltransferase [bacterium]|nr:class I SAM-dependent RNA methyltransferase [bacterium]